jgi:hypothetical protein
MRGRSPRRHPLGLRLDAYASAELATRGLLMSALVCPLGRARPSGPSGSPLLAQVPAGDFDHTCRRGRGVVHIAGRPMLSRRKGRALRCVAACVVKESNPGILREQRCRGFSFTKRGTGVARTGGEQSGAFSGAFRSTPALLLTFCAARAAGESAGDAREILISWAFLASGGGRRICAVHARCAHGPARYPCRAPLRPLSQTAPPTGSTPAGLQFRGAIACGRLACRRSVDQGIP